MSERWYRGHIDIARLLVAEFGVDPNQQSKVCHDYSACINVFVGEGRCMYSQHGETVVSRAACGGHINFVRMLGNEYKVDPNRQDEVSE